MVDKLAHETGVLPVWRPFVLRSDMPEEGLPWGLTSSEMERFRKSVFRQAIGWNLTIEIPPFRASSVLALQAAEFAKKHECFDKFHLKMFDAYWVEGRNIGQLKVVLETASSVGLPVDELAKHLHTGTFRRVVEKTQRDAEKLPCIPTFIIGSYQVHGIQAYDVLLRAVRLAS